MPEKQILDKKIEDLFRYRRIPHLLKLGGLAVDGEFATRLKTLQKCIYALDVYLEGEWKISKSGLAAHWKAINAELKGLGLNRNEVVRYRKEIERYQQYELAMRDGKLPTSKAFKTTYGAKSCDIQLIRRLIYREEPMISRHIKLSDWKAYDLVTEVNDDVEDVYEDMDAFNGNRFLISVLKLGKRKTQSEFNRFLKDIEKFANGSFRGRPQKEAQDLAMWTDKRIQQTRDLLKKRLGQKKLATLKDAVIASHL